MTTTPKSSLSPVCVCQHSICRFELDSADELIARQFGAETEDILTMEREDYEEREDYNNARSLLRPKFGRDVR